MVVINHNSETGVQTSQKLAQKPHRTLFVAIGVCCSLLSLPAFALSESDYSKPSGWSILEKSTVTGGHYSNVHTYKNSSGSVVALVDVPSGARVDMMQYQAPEMYNGFNTFYRGGIEYWWQQMSANSSRVLVMNAQFFGGTEDDGRSTLSFAIKDNGHVYPSGYASDGNGKARQLNIYPNNNVTVTPAPSGNYVEYNAPTAIVGKHITDLPSDSFSIGRSYLCAMPTYRGNNVLLMYTTSGKTESDANKELASWGCHAGNTLGMDGSGSSQIRTKQGYVSYGVSGLFGSKDKRMIPQVIGIYNDAN